VNLARAENHEGAMKKWLKHLNSTPFGFMPSGPRFAATGVASMIETALQPRFRVLSQLKKGRCLGLDDTQVKRIMPKDLPDKTDGIEDPQIMWLIEKMIEAKKERKDSLDAMM
jgi:hypothetical protein